MNNDLLSLNNILFEQIERINDDSVSEKDMAGVIKRAEMVNKLANTIVNNAEIQLKAYAELGRPAEGNVERLLGGDKK